VVGASPHHMVRRLASPFFKSSELDAKLCFPDSEDNNGQSLPSPRLAAPKMARFCERSRQCSTSFFAFSGYSVERTKITTVILTSSTQAF
jgi:hypothetical protein